MIYEKVKICQHTNERRIKKDLLTVRLYPIFPLILWLVSIDERDIAFAPAKEFKYLFFLRIDLFFQNHYKGLIPALIAELLLSLSGNMRGRVSCLRMDCSKFIKSLRPKEWLWNQSTSSDNN